MEQIETGQPDLAPAVEVPAVETAQPQAEVPTPESGAQSETAKVPKSWEGLSPEQLARKRIDQLTWQRHDAERRYNAELFARQQAEARAQQLEQERQEIQRRMSQPRFEQFQDPDQYARAVEEHTQRTIAQERQRFQEAQEHQRRTQAYQQFETKLQSRVVEAMQKYPDYAEVVGNPSLPQLPVVNPTLVEAILDHEQMGDITYYLAKNPQEAHRIAYLPPARAVMEVGRIAEKLAAKPAKTSSAPPPPAEVGSRAEATPKDPDKMSQSELIEWRMRERRKARGA